MAVAVARRAHIVAWLCAIGAISTFATHLPANLTPEPLAWLVGLASHCQWAYVGLALVGAALAVGLSSGHWRHVLVPLGMVAVAWLHQSPGAMTLTSADASTPPGRRPCAQRCHSDVPTGFSLPGRMLGGGFQYCRSTTSS